MYTYTPHLHPAYTLHTPFSSVYTLTHPYTSGVYTLTNTPLTSGIYLAHPIFICIYAYTPIYIRHILLQTPFTSTYTLSYPIYTWHRHLHTPFRARLHLHIPCFTRYIHLHTTLASSIIRLHTLSQSAYTHNLSIPGKYTYTPLLHGYLYLPNAAYAITPSFYTQHIQLYTPITHGICTYTPHLHPTYKLIPFKPDISTYTPH